MGLFGLSSSFLFVVSPFSEALLKQGEVEALEKAGFKLSVDDCVRIFSGFSPDKATDNFLEEMGRPLPPNFFKEQIEGTVKRFLSKY